MRNFRKILRLYQQLLFWAIVTVGSIVVIIAVIVPGAQEEQRHREAIGILSKEVDVLREKSILLSRISGENLRDQLTILLEAVPQEKSAGSMLSTLENLSGVHGLNFSDMTLDNPGAIGASSAGASRASVKKSGLGFVAFSASLQGESDQIAAFLDSNPNVRRILGIEAISLNFDEEAVATMKLEGDGYHAPLPTTLGRIDIPLEPLTRADEDFLVLVGNMELMGQDVLSGALVETPKSDPFAQF